MANISKLYGYDLKDAKAREHIGSLSSLTTKNDSSLVAAINELVGSTNTLTTTTSTFASINNELVRKVNDLTARVTSLEIGASNPEITLTGISATYTGGDVLIGTELTNLTGITVTATYSNDSTANVTNYALSGTIAEGDNTIFVVYEGFAATFVVVGVAEVKPASLLILNNRTLATSYTAHWFSEDYYINPSAYQHGNAPTSTTPCEIANLTENSITVTENGAGGTGVSFPFAIYGSTGGSADVDRRGKSFTLTWDTISGNTARFRARVGGVSNPQYVDLAKGNDGKTSATIVVSEDGKTVTINGTAFTRADSYIVYIAFFFGSSTGTTTSYTGVSLVENQ